MVGNSKRKDECRAQDTIKRFQCCSSGTEREEGYPRFALENCSVERERQSMFVCATLLVIVLCHSGIVGK